MAPLFVSIGFILAKEHSGVVRMQHTCCMTTTVLFPIKAVRSTERSLQRYTPVEITLTDNSRSTACALLRACSNFCTLRRPYVLR